MTDDEKRTILEELLSGCFYFTTKLGIYKVVSPTPEQKALGWYLAKSRCQSYSFDLISEEEATKKLDELGIWTYEDEGKLEISNKTIEDLKVDLYNAMFQLRQQESVRRRLKGIRTAIDESFNRKYYLMDKTFEFQRRLVAAQFLVGICTYDLKGNQMYKEDTFFNEDADLLQIAYSHFEKKIITEGEFREIARTSPWGGYYNFGAENVFGKPAAFLNDKQRTLIMFATMYSNARQSMDSPPDEVFEDDDMFDGWMLSERRKAEKDKEKKRADDHAGRMGKAGEVFIMAENPEEATRVAGINDFGNKMRLRDKLREVRAAAGEEIEEQNLSDVQMDLRRQMASEVVGKTGR